MSNAPRAHLRLAGALFLGLMIGTMIGLLFGPNFSRAYTSVSESISARLDRDIVVIPQSGYAPSQPARFLPSHVAAPLIVDVHSWRLDERGSSGDEGAQLDALSRARGWSYIRPRLTGRNDNPSACCSRAVIDGIASAIAYAKQHARVTHVFVLGGSGGGYTALCAALSGKLNDVEGYQAWGPITDLEAWYFQRAGDPYSEEIRHCTASDSMLNRLEARRRSPLYMSVPRDRPPIDLFAGIHDGAGTARPSAVPFSHAFRMFNRLSSTAKLPDSLLLTMMESRRGPQTNSGAQLGGRTIHLQASAPGVSLRVFEGSHELLAEAAVEQVERHLDRQPQGRPSHAK